MDTPSKLKEPLVNARPEVRRMKITANLICLLLSCNIMLLCHCAISNYAIVTFSNKVKSLKFNILRSTQVY